MKRIFFGRETVEKSYKLNRYLILLLSICSCLILLECTPKIKNLSPKLDAQNCHLELYLSLGGVPKITKSYLKEQNIQNVFFVNGSYIDKDNDLKVDREIFEKNLERIAPNPDADGIGVLDWEGNGLIMLDKLELDDPAFKEIEMEFIKAYKIAKKLRPNIKWGFYGLPFRDYWNRNEKWRTKNDKLKGILAATDAIYPSVYDFYENSNPYVGKKRDSLYVDENVTLALQYGKEFNKSVLPFYWHRWHNSNTINGMKLIPWEEFEQHIIAGISARYEDHKVEGIVWWGSDIYFYNKNSIVKEEIDKEGDFDTYQDNLIKKYTSKVNQLFEKYCNN